MTAQKFIGAFFVATSLTFVVHAPILWLTLFVGILMLIDENG